ncbi:hypothetical protein AK830_g2759 [Neonectria ditissima]|uniref:Uncharacterized protein n=1 Tax=Neonectria ditissima TaxID=78410 RepID=A0A0P7BRB0_9HYPO|nr:hypothetical protein AK830_g2759 [Neonectria ditissima]
MSGIPVQNNHAQGTSGPDSVQSTASEPGQSTNKSHAKGGGAASIVPQKIQEKLPESVERAVPNAIHDTGDSKGLHRKQ